MKALLPLLLLLQVVPPAEGRLGRFSLRPCSSCPTDWIIAGYAERARVSPRLVKAIIAVESENHPRAVSRRGAVGLMHVLLATAAELGVPRRRLKEPRANIRAGTAYLRWLFLAARRRYGLKAASLEETPSWVQRRVVAAYNGGPRLLYRNGWPLETRLYVRRVMRLARARETELEMLVRFRPARPAAPLLPDA